MRRILWKQIISLLLIFVIMSQSEAAMNTCASSCSSGTVYLTIPPEIVTPNKSAVDILKSENENAVTFFGVQVLASKEIVINVRLISNEQSTDGIAATVSAKLKPSYVRRNELSLLVLFFNSSSVCVLFENECLTECSKIPSLISSLSGFFKINSSISIDDNIAFTDNRTSVYMSTDNCKTVLFTDETYVKGIDNWTEFSLQKLL
jgi:hypothetical protein